MKIEVGQTYKLDTGGPCKIVHKLDLPGENHPYLGVSLACGSCAYFNETGASGSIRLIGKIEEPKLKPFTLETFPVEAWLRRRNETAYRRALYLDNDWIEISGKLDSQGYYWDELLAYFEYSVDGCKTWHQCGVKE